MREWIRLIVDVDYHPCDPGNTNWYCERTSYEKSALTAGKPLPYKDPGGLFGALAVTSVDEDGVELVYDGEHFTLSVAEPDARLDEGGRDYTEFELNVWLEHALVVEDSIAFYRQFCTKEGVAALRSADIARLTASCEPCAKYALGRWHYLLAPQEDSLQQAEALLREAMEAGVPDAYAALANMYCLGDTHEDRVDYPEYRRLLAESVARGSELGAYRLACRRIDGFYGVDAEPERVCAETAALLAAEQDPNPLWYSVLGYGWSVLEQNDKAREAYEAGVAHGCVGCCADLARLALRQDDREAYRHWMEEGMAQGCAWCCLLDADMSEEEYQANAPRYTYLICRQRENQLKRGIDGGEGLCAYFLGLYYLEGRLGFSVDRPNAINILRRGAALGNSYCCSLLADVLEAGSDSPDTFREAARLRLRAVRYDGGEDADMVDWMLEDFRSGLLDENRDEIESLWLPLASAEEADGDDGRWDAYV